MSPPPQSPSQRAESPPYTTSETNQSLDVYQQMFWQRQMAKVEEQASLLPEDLSGNVSAGSSSSKKSASSVTAAGPGSGSASSGKDLMDLFKPQAGQLPLARIKKVMKASDDQVKMISAEAPILFAKACEIFIADLTSRAYIHATSNRRRTVQQSDIVAAIAGSNQFDFLVDVVPRAADLGKGTSRKDATRGADGEGIEGGAEADVEGEEEEEVDESDEHTTD